MAGVFTLRSILIAWLVVVATMAIVRIALLVAGLIDAILDDLSKANARNQDEPPWGLAAILLRGHSLVIVIDVLVLANRVRVVLIGRVVLTVLIHLGGSQRLESNRSLNRLGHAVIDNDGDSLSAISLIRGELVTLGLTKNGLTVLLRNQLRIQSVFLTRNQTLIGNLVHNLGTSNNLTQAALEVRVSGNLRGVLLIVVTGVPGVPGSLGSVDSEGSVGFSGVVEPQSEGSSDSEVSEASEDVVSTDSDSEGSLDSDSDGSSDSEGCSLSELPGSSDSQVSLVVEVEESSEEDCSEEGSDGFEVSPLPPLPGTTPVVVVVGV